MVTSIKQVVESALERVYTEDEIDAALWAVIMTEGQAKLFWDTLDELKESR